MRPVSDTLAAGRRGRRRRRSPFAIAALAAVLALGAGPLFAYTIFLKDGSQILAKTKYKVQGARAIITLPSGADTAYPLADIDVERTEKENKTNLGTAVVIAEGKAVDIGQVPPQEKKPSLEELIQSRQAEIKLPEKQARRIAESTTLKGGAPDLGTGNRTPYRDVEISGDLKSFLFSRGIDGIEIVQGPKSHWPVIVATTNSEAAVFKSLVASCNALLVVREKYSAKIDGVDLVCVVPNGGRGGQFALSPGDAAEIVSGKVDITRWYVDHVQF